MLVQMSAAVDFDDNLAFCSYGIIRVIHYQLGWQLVLRLLQMWLLFVSTDSCR